MSLRRNQLLKMAATQINYPGDLVLECEPVEFTSYYDLNGVMTEHKNNCFGFIIEVLKGGTVTVSCNGITKSASTAANATANTRFPVIFGNFKGGSTLYQDYTPWDESIPPKSVISISGDYGIIYKLNMYINAEKGIGSVSNFITKILKWRKPIPYSDFAFGDSFKSIFSEEEKITNITIPYGQIVYYEMFKGCENLSNIEIPEGIEYIGERAFQDTNVLYFDLPITIKAIGRDVFLNTPYYNNESNWSDGILRQKTFLIKAKPNITIANIDEDITVIANHCFDECLLTEINFNAIRLNNFDNLAAANYARSIDRHFSAFVYYKVSEHPNAVITYPKTVLNIGNKVEHLPGFFFCSGTKDVSSGGSSKLGGIEFNSTFVISQNIKSVGKYAFYGESKTVPNFLVSKDNPLIIPETINILEPYSFSGNFYSSPPCYFDVQTSFLSEHIFENNNNMTDGYLKSVKLSNLITVIPKCAFKNQTVYLTSLTLPEKLIRIEDEAFNGCTKLDNLIIPATVNYIGKLAFGGQSGVTKITFNQPSGMSIELPTPGSGSGMFYYKNAITMTVYTDNETIKNYNYAADNVTVTVLHLDGSAWV